MRIHASRPLAVAILLSSVSGAAFAQSTTVRTPNVTNAAGSNSVTLNGETFVNQGLVGAGRLGANTRDFRNETLGSFSSMAIDLSTWHRNADGTYSSSIYTLPDRGPFDGAIDYRDRVHTENISFTPLAAGSGNLPQTTASQNQLTITPTGGFTLKDANGVEMTGRNPGASTVTRDGIIYPLATDGTAAGRIALDPEAIAFLPNGNFYVSDEYAAGIYLFDATGKQIGGIQTVPAMLPRVGGTVNFDSNVTAVTGVSGRRGNQGLEAMALTPDNKKLVTILQSATLQDTNGTAQATRNNTRILIYDISSDPTPTNPIAHYVLQLPTFTNLGTGGTPDRTAAQSEMLALNDTQFLVLSRDGLGRGVAGTGGSTTPVFKSILLVDTTGATNLAGTNYETGTTPIATNGTLNAGIVPVKQVELVNMLNPTQLARVGMNANFGPTNPTSLSEKWEAMALAPVLEENAPQDFFLFVGNDNDFRGDATRFDGNANGAVTNIGTPDGGSNDSVLLVYRVTLPTYVDPQALRAMEVGAPVILSSLRSIAATIGSATTAPSMDRLSSLRRIGGGALGNGPSLWMDLGWQKNAVVRESDGVTLANPQGLRVAGGIDFGVGPVRLGVSVAAQEAKDGSFGANYDAKGTTVGIYAGFASASGFYLQATGGRSVDLKFDDVSRPGAYGLTGTGKTSGDVWSGAAEVGYMAPLGGFSAGPFGGVEYVDASVDGYTEKGASLGNIVYPDVDYKRLRYSAGAEVRGNISEAFVPSIRAAYVWEDEKGDKAATTRLASAEHAIATISAPLASTERNHVLGAIGLQGQEGRVGYRFGGEGRFAEGEDDYRVSLGLFIAM